VSVPKGIQREHVLYKYYVAKRRAQRRRNAFIYRERDGTGVSVPKVSRENTFYIERETAPE